jgi:hypothetical protein
VANVVSLAYNKATGPALQRTDGVACEFVNGDISPVCVGQSGPIASGKSPPCRKRIEQVVVSFGTLIDLNCSDCSSSLWSLAPNHAQFRSRTLETMYGFGLGLAKLDDSR